ncbi:MAG: hypothetical protein A2289_04360 [Deltaproteobacteria bacterium RIFOXYA12_FULL_58_15]|nr:MAG: hypothetical protein A2289_04360 [Deltaproteobacteria bacterium RIFOXYA12_FULL_58_15]OGR10394.1 MAG: hypothetical protein A2341_23020 [Deltaproteobacteria bacterium RIFOXYB12_FULL_58_9]
MTLETKRLLNLIVLALVGAIVGWLVFWQRGTTEVKEEQKQAEQKLLSIIDTRAVVRLTLTTPQTEFVVEKEGEQWTLTTPLRLRADNATIEGLIAHVSGLERQRLVGEENGGQVEPPQELWMFALEPPRFRVKLEERGGAAHELLVGKKSGFDGSVYVKRADTPAVAMVDGAITYQVDKDLFQLRDKRLVDFAEEDIVRVQVSLASGAGYTIERTDIGFFLRAPQSLPANEAQVSGILTALASAKATKFLTEAANPEDMTRYGLDVPTASITVVDEANKSTTVLLRTVDVKDSRSHYAMCEGETSPILELGTDWLLKKIVVDVATLRDRRVLRFNRDLVSAITVSHGEAELAFARSWNKDKSRDSWQLLRPENIPVEDAILTGLIYRLWSLEGRDVNDAPAPEDFTTAGLDVPDTTIAIQGADGATIGTFLFSQKSQVSENNRFVTTDAKAQIATVDGSVISELSLSPDDYRVEEQ